MISRKGPQLGTRANRLTLVLGSGVVVPGWSSVPEIVYGALLLTIGAEVLIVKSGCSVCWMRIETGSDALAMVRGSPGSTTRTSRSPGVRQA